MLLRFRLEGGGYFQAVWLHAVGKNPGVATSLQPVAAVQSITPTKI